MSAKKAQGSTPASGGRQATLLGFFKRTPGPAPVSTSTPASTPSAAASTPAPESTIHVLAIPTSSPRSAPVQATPVPASRALQQAQDAQSSPASQTPSSRGRPGRRGALASGKENRTSYKEDASSDEEALAVRPVKRRKQIEAASEDEYGPDIELDSELEAAMDAVMELEPEDEEMEEDDDDDDVVTLKKRKSVKAKAKSKSSHPPSQPQIAATVKRQTQAAAPQLKSLASFHADSSPPPLQRESSSRIPTTKVPLSRQEELVQTVRPWLRPENIRDADRRKPDDPLYNPRTLYIPPAALSEFGNFEAQFWSFKRENWDAVIFFQKGKFYELYEDDAVLGHQLFDLKLTSRGMRMVGVPDYTFDDWAAQFVAKGYRVARVDQMESILGKDIREKDGAKKDKIVRRELTQVLTQGTLVDPNMLTGDHNTYILALKEIDCDTDGAIPTFGVCFADAATGQCFFSRFTDDLARTQLDTLLAQLKPRELVLEKGRLSPASTKCVRGAVSPQTQYNWIKEVDFWDAERVRLELREARYFEAQEEERWHAVLQAALADEAMGTALGGLLWYLRNLKLDHDLLSLANFEIYNPLQRAESLVLDGGTLLNLEVFNNTWDGGPAGTLFNLVCRCKTPMGKRLLRRWVCHPLRDHSALAARFGAVDLLMTDRALADLLQTRLAILPDLERQLARLHVGRCKISEFVKVLAGLTALSQLLTDLGDTPVLQEAPLIQRILAQAPDMTDALAAWRAAFDWEAASSSDPKRPGVIIPSPGTEDDFDASQVALEQLESQFGPLLKDYQRTLKSSKIAYRDVGSSKDLYQIEVPVSIKVPGDWQQMSATKQVKRYWSPEVAELVRSLLEQQERHKAIVASLQQRLYHRFDADFTKWHALVMCGAQLDCLLSLAQSSQLLGSPACRPNFIESETSILDLRAVRHPCADTTTFIPNDILLGGAGTDKARMSLLTGPNMAGKSTLLRSACTAVLLAQLGHYVPAASCTLTPMDQVSVRTGGARDNIGGGQSTFMVELAETATLLSSATPRSLVVLDELGRGTGTFDGMAVAFAVLQHLLTQAGCLGFFSTHYALLAREFENHPGCKFENMSFLLDESAAAGQGQVTFLYKLVRGICAHSHGLNVARMAGLPTELIEVAAEASREFEAQHGVGSQQEIANRQGLPLGLEADLAMLLAATEGTARDVPDQALVRMAEYACTALA